MSFSSTVKRNCQAAYHCQTLPDRGNGGYLKPLRTGEDIGIRPLCHCHPYRKSGSCKKILYIIEKTFNINTDVLIRQGLLPARSRTYVVAVREHEDALRVLQAAKLLDANGEIAEDLSLVHNVIVQNTCCRRAFIRGAFLAAGSISDPEKFYHFEITCASMGKAKQLQGLMASFGIDARIVLRKRYFVVYVKEGSQIVDLLNIMEAPVALMELENIRIVKKCATQ